MKAVASRLVFAEIGILFLILVAFVLNDTSSFLSRMVLITTFAAILAALYTSGLLRNDRTTEKHVLIILAFASVFFLLWRVSFFNPTYFDRYLNSEVLSFRTQYAEEGKLVFGPVHSFFFTDPMIMHFLYSITGIPPAVGIVVLYALDGTLVALLSFLLWKTALRKRLLDAKLGKASFVFPLIISFLLVASAYSERTHTALLLTLMVMWFVFAKGVTNVRENIILLLLVLGITFGDINGMLVLIPFFLLFSFLGKKRTTSVYAVIPIAYLIFSAYSYTLTLKGYAAQVYTGFTEFFEKALSGEATQSILPWQKPSARLQADTYVASAAYLSLLVLASMTVVASIFLWARERRIKNKGDEDTIHHAGLICLLLFLCLAALTYIGVSGRETSFSDIRTITVVLLSLLLPFLLISKKMMSCITSSKILSFFVIVLIIIASIRTVYEVYPKSVSDPIYVVEDNRLGSASVYIVADFLNTYYKTGGIVADYKVLNLAGKFFPSPQYATRSLNETTLGLPFESFPDRSILVFDSAGIMYPSLYHPPEAYEAAYNFSMTHNRIYDNGVMVIACQQKQSAP
jgi:hypothetical protein